jgi:hypothetical protein
MLLIGGNIVIIDPRERVLLWSQIMTTDLPSRYVRSCRKRLRSSIAQVGAHRVKNERDIVERLPAHPAAALPPRSAAPISPQQPMPPQQGNSAPAPTPLQPEPMPQPDPQVLMQLQEIIKAPSWEEISSILRSDKRRAGERAAIPELIEAQSVEANAGDRDAEISATGLDDYLNIRPWRPKPEHNPSKRKSRTSDPFGNLGAYRQISREDLDTIISNLGPDFDIDAAKRTTLLNDINDLVLNLFDLADRTQKLPGASEMKERMKSVETFALKLLEVLEVKRSPEKIFQQPVLPKEINPHLRSWLAKAVDSERPDCELVSNVASAVAVLATLAKRAQLHATPKGDRQTPLQMLSTHLSDSYREAFGKEPTHYAGSPWVQFLGGVIKAALNLHHSKDLRQLPIRR